jgi:hypothetical protein
MHTPSVYFSFLSLLGAGAWGRGYSSTGRASVAELGSGSMAATCSLVINKLGWFLRRDGKDNIRASSRIIVRFMLR